MQSGKEGAFGGLHERGGKCYTSWGMSKSGLMLSMLSVNERKA